MPKKPYFAFGVSFYNDAKSLERCLQSIFLNKELVRSYAFRVIMIDGKYKGYPMKSPLSDDGSREIAQCYVEDWPVHCKLYDYPNLHERHKRQKYVDITASLGIPFLIILDSDDWIDITPKERVHDFVDELEFIEDLWKKNTTYSEDGKYVDGTISNVHSVKSIDMDDQGIYPINVAYRPRLWYRPQDMVYTTKHYYFKNRHISPEVLQNWNRSTGYKTLYIKNMAMYHSHDLRDQDMETRRKFYQTERLPKLEP